MKKRLFAMLLALCMVLSWVPMRASAEEAASGTWGDNLTWTLNDEGTLTISGEGPMAEAEGDDPTPSWLDYADSIKTVVIEEGITSISASSFSWCEAMTAITIPESVTSIGENAFTNSTALATVVLPDSLTEIGDWAFNATSSLTEITIPGSVKTIGASAFRESGIQKLTVEEGVEVIGSGAFMFNGLEEVTLPDSLKRIENNAFQMAFPMIPTDEDSYKSFTLVIPAGVEYIGQTAFFSNPGLTLIFAGDAPEIETYALEGIADTVYYPANNDTWTEEVMQAANPVEGAFNWVPYGGSRVSGGNRFETAVQVADQMKEALGVEKFDAIILANGYNFADALSGSYLAAVKNAPILLTWNGSEKYDYLNEYTVDYVKANLKEGGTVYILGGTSAVPETVDAMLEGYNIVRMDGANRFETNIMILEEAGVQPGQEILVCTSTNFADSLSASAAGKPILLVWNEGGKLFDSQIEYLSTLTGNTFTVIGGENAVSADLANLFSGYGETTRLAGANRFETSVLVAEKYFDSPESAVLAYAWDFPDGLCGGSLAYAMDAPLVLTMTNYDDEAVAYAAENGIIGGIVLGGEKLISKESVQTIFGMDAGE